MRQTKYRFLLLPVLFVLVGVFAFAQANSTLTGIVTDQSGAVVAGAKIALTNPATGAVVTTESGATGLFNIPGLNPANYNLKITAKGFQSYEQNGIVVNVSSTVREDVKLTVGAESQTVTVEADALQVQTDSNVVSTLISSEQITEIATQNRNFAALAALGLGVSSALPDSNTPTSVAANFTISVNGLRQSHNIWLIDGGEADDRGGAGGMNIMPSQDAIAEFNMMTSNYPPDYGISSGATMSLSLKSGTQKFHGSLWEFNRTPAYNAKNPITRSLTNAHYNIFGGNIGGPLMIPHVYNTDRQKTFFFWNEEWRKILSGAGTSNVNTLPDADRPVLGTNLKYVSPAFSSVDLHVPKFDAVSDPNFAARMTALGLVSGGCFTGVPDSKGHCTGQQIIPASLFDSNAVLYMNSSLVPRETPGAGGKALANVANPINVRDDIVRVDHKFNDKWAILGHYMHDSVTQGYAQPHLGWLWASFNTVSSTLDNPSNSAAIKMTGQINPNLVVEASINYDGNIINITNSSNSFLTDKAFSGWNAQAFFPLSGVLQGKGKGQKSAPGVGGGWGGPYSVAEDLGSDPWHNAAQDYAPKLDVSYTMGKHAMKYGFSYNRYTKNQQLFGDTEGNYGFGSLTNDSFMDMLLGLASSYSQFQNAPIRHYVNQTPSAYVMDNWHVTPRLSLQLGIRYDALPHAWERSNAVANFDEGMYLSSSAPKWATDSQGKLTGAIDTTGPGIQVVNGTSFYLNGIGLAGRNGYPTGLVVNDYKTLQPRIGFSEDLFGNGKTVLRGGFGTFYERMQGNDIYNAATTPPFAYNPSAGSVYFSNPGTSWVTGAHADTPTFPSSITNLARTYKAPAVAQFSLGVQRELSPSLIWVVQYVGNIAWHQNIQRPINNYPINTDMNIRCNAGDSSAKFHFGFDPNAPADVCPAAAAGVDSPNPLGGAPKSLVVGDRYRSFPGWAGITQEENTTNGNYNGFQTGLRIQNRWGLSGEVDYTWSHEIDLTTYDLNTVSNPWNLKYDKGSGALDRRHILSINYVYKLPIFTQSTGLAHSILGGWTASGTVIAERGVIPANQGPGVSLNYDSIGLGGGYTNRPDVNGKVKYPKKFNLAKGENQWYDTSQFTPPVPVWLGGQNQGFGNAGKDAIVGPGRLNFTTSLYKSFAVTERAHFELRFESFNTFNHTEPNGLSAAGPVRIKDSNYDKLGIGNTQAGQITSVWDPRTLELGGKFIF